MILLCCNQLPSAYGDEICLKIVAVHWFQIFLHSKKKNMMDNLSSSMMDRTTSQVSPKTNSSMYYIQEYLQTTYLLYYSVSTLVFSVYYYVINAFPCRCQMDCKITKMRHGNGLLMIFFFLQTNDLYILYFEYRLTLSLWSCPKLIILMHSTVISVDGSNQLIILNLR